MRISHVVNIDRFKHIWVSLEGSTSFLNALWTSACCSNHSKLAPSCTPLGSDLALWPCPVCPPTAPTQWSTFCCVLCPGEQCRGGNFHILTRMHMSESRPRSLNPWKTRLHSVSSFYLLLLFYLNYILMIETASKELDAFFSLSSPS